MSGTNDPISDYIVRLKTANMSYFKTVDIPMSKIKLEITKLLKENNFIRNFKVIRDRKQGLIRIYLKYGENRERYLTDMKRVSTPGWRKYKSSNEIPSMRGKLGLTIVTTSKGVISGKKAKENNVGGEVICFVW